MEWGSGWGIVLFNFFFFLRNPVVENMKHIYWSLLYERECFMYPIMSLVEFIVLTGEILIT